MVRYVLDSDVMSEPAKQSFDDLLRLVRHGAKFIDVRVRKDGIEYHFEADVLKYMRPEEGFTEQDAPEQFRARLANRVIPERTS